MLINICLFLSIWFFNPFNFLFFEVVIRKFYIFYNPIYRLPFFSLCKDIIMIFFHFLRNILILHISNFFLINLNDLNDLILKESWQLFMILIIFTQHNYLIRKLEWCILSFKEFTLLVEDDLILHMSKKRIVIVLIHILDSSFRGLIVVVVISFGEDRKSTKHKE